MNNVLITIGGIDIYWYSVLILIAVILGFILANKEAKRVGLGQAFIIDLIVLLVVLGVLGARIYYVAFNFSEYRDNLIDILKIWEGGLAIYGAVIGGIIAVLIICKNRDKSVLRTLDVLAPSLILGQAIGRWGNFFNSEAYGSETSLSFLQNLHLPQFIIDGMYINGSYYQPTFLYESLWCLLGFIILILVRRIYVKEKLGTITGMYFIFYPLGRLFIENIRTDSLYIGDYKVSMIVSVIMILSGIIILITSKNREKYIKSEEIYVNL